MVRRRSHEGQPVAPLVLPEPVLRGEVSLEEVLQHRRSVREFRRTPLTLQQLAQLLWAAQGITGRGGLRTAPSAGALHPLELYIALPEGLHRYDPRRHRLETRSNEDLRPALCRTALEQDPVLRAPAVFVISGVVARTRTKYGARATRYVYVEAGHAAQNLLLEAAALGLGGVPIGAYEDARVRRVLGLDRDENPLYLIPVGVPISRR